MGGRLLPSALVLLIVASVCASLALPTGFAGWDDLHYLQAAQRWLAEGAHVPANHWATRLPYVLTIAASLRLFGLSVLALTVPNTVLFALTLLLVWRIGRQVFDAQAALCAVLVAATTPLLLRMPTTYYPEVMEIAFAGGATALTLQALRQSTRRHAALLLAGVVGGGGILVRQTALSVPLALSVLIVLSERARPRQAIVSILLLGAGFSIPVALEALFYLVMTGDPLGRLRIDSRHVLIPSVHLRGSTFTGGTPLFNWKLASEWDVPSVIRVHWTINPVLRVFTSPGLLLAPWLCLAGGVAAWRRGGIARRYAIFAGVGFLAQYLLNTFVLVIAPDTRYFSVSVALALPLAGFWLRHLSRVFLSLVAGLLLVTPCLLIMWFAPAPAHLMPALEQYMAREQPIYISQDLAAAATILLAHSGRAAQVRPLQDQDRVPVGALAVLDPYGWSAVPAHRCADGQVEWQPVNVMPGRSISWTVLDATGLLRHLPSSLAHDLDGHQDRLSLVRRAC